MLIYWRNLRFRDGGLIARLLFVAYVRENPSAGPGRTSNDESMVTGVFDSSRAMFFHGCG